MPPQPKSYTITLGSLTFLAVGTYSYSSFPRHPNTGRVTDSLHPHTKMTVDTPFQVNTSFPFGFMSKEDTRKEVSLRVSTKDHDPFSETKWLIRLKHETDSLRCAHDM